MKHFYLDNFKGFQDQYISIDDVSFLVGENSSGKTSFLSLIEIMSSQSFWMKQTFDFSENSIGHFDEIVSINSSDKTYFRLGYSEKQTFRNEDGEKEEQIISYLFTFKNKDGLPRIYKCTHFVDGNEITIIITPKKVRYKVEQIDNRTMSNDSDDKRFRRWANEHKKPISKGFKELPEEMYISDMDSFPIYLYFYSIIHNIFERSKSNLKHRVSRLFLRGPASNWDVAWIAPIRTKPKRTYDEVRLDFSPEGEHTPYVLKKILDGGAESIRFTKFVKRFGEESGLFKDVNVHRFGSSHSSPFELDILLDYKPLNISSVGYGVSQALPLVVELFVRDRGTWFCIQQPEVHLHPRAQAAFGEMIFQLASNEKKNFVVETHSDYTIDRFRMSCRGRKKIPSSQILFFERRGGKNHIHKIKIDKNGDISSNQPKRYREFFVREDLKLLGVG